MPFIFWLKFCEWSYKNIQKIYFCIELLRKRNIYIAFEIIFTHISSTTSKTNYQKKTKLLRKEWANLVEKTDKKTIQSKVSSLLLHSACDSACARNFCNTVLWYLFSHFCYHTGFLRFVFWCCLFVTGSKRLLKDKQSPSDIYLDKSTTLWVLLFLPVFYTAGVSFSRLWLYFHNSHRRQNHWVCMSCSHVP